MDIEKFWSAVLRQDAEEMRSFFHPDAYINWHCTNEHFTLEEFITANCRYPGDWDGEIEKIVEAGETLITAAHVFSKDGSLSFHVVSFINRKDGRILSIDEYWGDDGNAPEWRQALHIGTKIRT